MAKRPRNREEQKQRDESSEKRRRNERILNAQLRESQKILENILETEEISLQNYADKLQIQAQLTEGAKAQATIIAKIKDLENSGAKNSELLINQYTMVNDLVGQIQSKYVDVVKNSGNIASDSFEIVDVSKELEDILDRQYELDEMRGELGKKEYQRLTEILKVAKDKLQVIDETNKSQEIANKLALDYLESSTLVGATTKKLLGGLESMKEHVGTGGLGIIGDVLGSKAGKYIEEIEGDIQGKIVKAFQDSGESAISAFSVAKMAFGSFIKFALPALGIMGLLGIIGGLISLASHLDEELSEVGKTFGVSRVEAEKIHHSAKDIAKEMKIVGINSAEVTDAIKETSSVLGGLHVMQRMQEGSEATKQLVKDVAVLNNVFGLTDAESGGLSNISDFAVMMGKSIGQVVKESVKLGKGLLSAKQSITVIGKISPGIAIAFKKGSVELLKAAQKAKLLGMELDDVADFGDRILEIESSLESEMTARVITGRQLNFDLARQYALQGDVASLQQEMLTQLGSLAEYQSMNRLQQKYMAEAFGMTVDEVAKLLTAQEKLVELGIDQTRMDDIQTMNAQELAEEIKNTNNEKLKGYLQTLAKEKESASINERISDAMTKIKEKIAGTLAPLLEQAHQFLTSAEGAEFLQSMVKGIESAMKTLVPVVKFLADNMWILVTAFSVFAGAKLIKGASTIASVFKGIGGAATASKPAIDSFAGAFGDLSKEMGTATQASDALGQSMGGAGGAAQGISGFTNSFTSIAVNMVLVGVALAAFAGALWITSQAFAEFAKLSWDDIEKGIRVMWSLTAVAAVLTLLAVAITDSGAILALLALAGALGVFALAVMGIGYGAKLFADAISEMANGLKKFMSLGNISKISDQIKEVINSVSNIGSNIDPSKTSNLKNALENLGIDELVDFGKLANIDLKKAARNVLDAIDSFSQISFEREIDFGKRSDWVLNEVGGYTKKLGTGIIGAFEQLNEAIGELELESLEALAKIAGTDMSKLGINMKNAIESLAKLEVTDETMANLEKTNVLFSKIRDVFEDYNMFGVTYSNLDPLEKLASFDMNKVRSATSMMSEVINNLSQLGSSGEVTGLDLLTEKFTKLSEALEALNTDKLKDLSNINADNFAKIAAVFQQPAGVGRTTAGGTSSTEGGGESEESKMNKKLDQVISVLTNILAATNQPTNINIGGRTIETIGTEIQGIKNRTIGIGANGAVLYLQ